MFIFIVWVRRFKNWKEKLLFTNIRIFCVSKIVSIEILLFSRLKFWNNKPFYQMNYENSNSILLSFWQTFCNFVQKNHSTKKLKLCDVISELFSIPQTLRRRLKIPSKPSTCGPHVSFFFSFFVFAFWAKYRWSCAKGAGQNWLEVIARKPQSDVKFLQQYWSFFIIRCKAQCS